MARTGVAPMPALISSTGASVRSRMNVPRGAAIVELVADAEAGVEVAAGGAVGLALDGDPVVAGVGRPREGVVAEHRPLARRRAGCARVRYWPGRAAGSGAPSGSSRRIEITDSLSRSMPATASRRKPGQAGGGLVDREAGVAAAGVGVEQGAERRLPARAEGRDPERPQQLLARVAREVEQRVDLGDRHLLGAGGELDDLVPRLHLALLEHAEVEARAAVGDQQGGDARVVHPDPDAVAGDAGLGDLEDGGADPVAVADADLVVAQPLDGEVLAELPVDEVVPTELALPVPVGVELVDEDGALLAAVPREVALAVAVDVEPAHAARAGDRILEDAREDRLPLPGHVLRHADVEGDQLPDATSGVIVRARAHLDAEANQQAARDEPRSAEGTGSARVLPQRPLKGRARKS